MKRWIRLLHKWAGLVLALQFVLWMASGLAMSLLDHDAVEGRAHRADRAGAPPVWPAGLRSPSQIIRANAPVLGLEAMWLFDRPVYRLTTASTVRLVDAANGRPLLLDATTAQALAEADYVGEGAAGPAGRLAVATAEVRGHDGPIWRVRFDDADDTTLYLSAQDGRILERRNRHWRLFDLFWMLHIMDYRGREDFNNPLVVMAAAGGVWMALTGVWLLVVGLRLRPARPPAPL